jgi:hypothetical protein
MAGSPPVGAQCGKALRASLSGRAVSPADRQNHTQPALIRPIVMLSRANLIRVLTSRLQISANSPAMRTLKPTGQRHSFEHMSKRTGTSAAYGDVRASARGVTRSRAKAVRHGRGR